MELDYSGYSTNRLQNGIIEIIEPSEQESESVKLFDVSVSVFYGQGQQKRGVETGPFYLSQVVNEAFGLNKYALAKPGVERIYPTDRNGTWKKDYEILYDYLKQQKNYVLLGGDHSIGNPSVASSIYKTDDVNDLYVIWIDAHADSNTMSASITKNIHGQPLASILGWEDPWFPIKETLPTTNLLYFGIRDLDQFEVDKIKEHNIFNTTDLQVMMAKIDEIIKHNNNAKFHVSFDVDALDGKIMTSTGCVVDNGLTPVEVSTVIRAVKFRLIAFDLVEFNPELGNKGLSLKIIKDIITDIARQ